MVALAGAGRVELDFAVRLVEAELPATWIPRTDTVEMAGPSTAEPGFVGAWDATEGSHSYVEGNLKNPAAMQKRLAETLAKREGPEDNGGLRLDIDRDVEWARVVEVAEAASKAGYAHLHIVFKAKSPVAAPPPSPVHDQLVNSLEARDAVWKSCKQVPSYYFNRVPGGRSDRELRAEEAAAVPAAIEACGCAVDFAVVRDGFWASSVGNGTHRTAATFQLAAKGGDATVVKQAAKAHWSEVAPAVIEASRAAKPVRFAR